MLTAIDSCFVVHWSLGAPAVNVSAPVSPLGLGLGVATVSGEPEGEGSLFPGDDTEAQLESNPITSVGTARKTIPDNERETDMNKF